MDAAPQPPVSRTALAAQAVRREVGDRRLSARQVGEIIGVITSGTHRRLTGEIPFKLDELQALADAWDLPVATLLGQDQQV